MQVDTLVSSHPTFTDLSQSEPSLVRLQEAGLPAVASSSRLFRSYQWPLRFVLTAALGAMGGLAAAIVLNPAPLVLSSPSQQVQPAYQSSRVVPSVYSLPVATTTVVVPAAGKAAPSLSTPEITRLQSRNKRLEALVLVLRQRPVPRSASN